ncbi:casein kinase 2 regulatory subunit [Elasticomyces elasticus]|nr:casein kinase 2 regulatory subunit [Elasticomyces elasticus]KAK5024551.1 casein kinase 2 regulatory subunit [Exophiala sideris]
MSQTSSQSPDSWIGQFCNLVGHEYFAEVSEDFIEDDFNLTGLQAQVPMYKDALEMILDVEPSETNSSELSEEEEEEEEEEDDGLLGDELDEPAQNGATRQPGLAAGGRRHGRSSSDTSVIESSAELLYGLIHSRYITSRPGIQQMMENCLDVYTPPNSRFQAVDGAFFGTTFPYLFLMSYPDLEIAPLKKRAPRDSVGQANDDVESTLSPTENASRGGMTASRSSSLTLPQPPAIPGVTATKDEKPLIPNNAVPSLPPQPATINGFATNNLAPGLGKGKIYEPKIYGFRVSERAKSGPRMKWLRSKPADVNELDEARIWHERYGGTVDGDPDEEPGATSGEMEDEDAEDELADADGDAIMGSQSQNNGKGRSKRGDASGITQGPARGKAKRKSAQQAGQPESENWI